MEKVVVFTCHKFPEMGVTPEILLKAQVIRLGEVAIDLHQHISELEANMARGTPTKVLKAQQKELTESVQKIQEVEGICVKAYVQVSQSWESLMDDAKLEKITEQLHNT